MKKMRLYNKNKGTAMKNENIQDDFLTLLKNEKIVVSVFLVNGIKLHGTIASFDTHALMLKNSITQMVFKHAISTVVPSQNVAIPGEESAS